MRNKYYRKFRRDGVPMLVCVYALVWFVVIVLLSIGLCGCKSTEYVPVVETHTEHHWHTDSVHQTDSVISHETTLIKEVDSATMAKYGVQLKNMERAWLIQNDKLQRELSKLQSVKTDTFIKVDTVQVPYPVERKATAWEQVRLDYGGWAIGILFISVIVVIRFSRKLLPRW